MKQLTFKLVLPLTVITFFVFTRWVCAQVVDTPNSVLQGFPLPYTCPDWGSSMALQFFVTEFAIDILVYFIFIFVAVYLIDRFVLRIQIHKAVLIVLSVVAVLVLSFQVLIYSRDTTFFLHRWFDIKVIGSAYGFFWQNHPDCF